MSKTNLTMVNRQWSSRPDDERWTDIAALHASTLARAERSFALPVSGGRGVLPIPTDDGDLRIDVDGQQYGLTNWSASQLAGIAGVPANYLATLPPRLATANLMYGLRQAEDRLALYVDGETRTLRAATSPSYGRIHDHQVVAGVRRLWDAGWQIPAASYADRNPLRATTLYGSDRDVFMFLVDPSRPIQLPGQDKPSYRGVIAWNSEVGASRFGLMAFLYEFVCDNRIIWGTSRVETLELVHTKGAPERFLEEATPQLLEYAGRAEALGLAPVERAQARRLSDIAGDEQADQLNWLSYKSRIPAGTVRRAWQQAADEGEPTDTVWDAVQALTAHARTIPYQDRRLVLEQRAGGLLQ
jgi:hypothetical protein